MIYPLEFVMYIAFCKTVVNYFCSELSVFITHNSVNMCIKI